MPTQVRTSDDQTKGVRTFHVQSSGRDHWYVVKRIRRPGASKAMIKARWMCSCPDFMHRGMQTNRHCKHIKLLRAHVIAVGGVSKVPRGTMLSI
jgi:hypothetical protein